MADKVQGRPERSETCIFHHGLMKLLVLEELNKLDRHCTSFMFMNGYEMDVLSPRKTSKLKTLSPRQELNTTTEVEENQQEGLKATGKDMEVEANFIQEVGPHQPTNKHAKKHVINSKTKPTSKRSKGSTKETIGGKRRLEDIL